jgi:hypothetical protein
MELYQGRETIYEMHLSLFIAKNKNSTEKDYINSRIEEENQRLVQRMALTDEEIIKKIKDKNKEHINHSNYDEGIKYRIEKEISGNKTGIRRLRKEIKFFQDKLKLIQLLEKEEYIDLSIEKNTEKIILLHQLGIIEFLNNKAPFNTSVNKLATIISAITGIKPTTTQSYLNPMLNENTDQKSNPLNTTKSVEKIKQKLLSIGYNLDDIK